MKGLIIFLILFAQTLFAQNTISLFDCYSEAMKSDPLSRDKSNYKSINDLNIKNLKTAWMPKVEVNGQATYQSDVTHIPNIQIPNTPIAINIPQMQKDMYKLTLDISQTIYDGGVTAKQKLFQIASLAVDSQQVTVELNQLKTQINQVYFSILLLQNQKKLIESINQNISEKIKQVESGVRNGTLLASALDILKVQQLKLMEQTTEIDYSVSSGIKILGILIGKNLDEKIQLIYPDFLMKQNNIYKRPEFVLFNLQKDRLDQNIRLSSTERMPKLFGFGQAGYGRPGLNMLNNSFSSFYYVGAGLKWTLWDWNKVNRQKQIFSIQKELIETRKLSLEKNLSIAMESELSEFNKYDELIQKDNEIIALRNKITQNASSQMMNGSITATDYLTELNSETQEKINLETHKIQVFQAKINYLTLKGDL